MSDNRTGYKVRLSKPQLWNFRQVSLATKQTMQRIVESHIDQVIADYIASGGVLPPCPYPDDPAPEDLTTFKEVISTFGDDLIDAGFTKALLTKYKQGKVIPSEREYKVISNVTGLAIDHLKELP